MLGIASLAERPPSTASTAPVTNELSVEQRNATTAATSSGVPTRPSGAASAIRGRRSGGCDTSNMSVWMKPGATALTRIPRPPYSIASDCVTACRPALLAT